MLAGAELFTIHRHLKSGRSSITCFLLFDVLHSKQWTGTIYYVEWEDFLYISNAPFLHMGRKEAIQLLLFS